MLVDLGSKYNIMGTETKNEFNQRLEPLGHQIKYSRPSKPLMVGGIGAGSSPCNELAEVPIAVQYQEEAPRLDTYTAHVASGTAADTPAIWGLDSMQDKDTVLILRKGKETIAFPGPGGYEIKWSPGTKLLSMEKAPSGHLLIPCDQFEKVKGKSDHNEQMAFTTDNTYPLESPAE